MTDQFQGLPGEADINQPGPEIRPKSLEEVQALAPGTSFYGPDNQLRQKPYPVKSPEELENVPEGAHFVGPDGNIRVKPTFDSIGVGTQTLYDMAVTDAERDKILRKAYPDAKITKMGKHTVIDDKGVLRTPGHGAAGVVGDLAASAFPTAAAGVGAALGVGAGASSAAVLGPGAVPVAFAGGAAGAATGAAAGQAVDDLILALAGDYDRSAGQEAVNLAGAAGAGVAGELVGGAVGAAPKYVANVAKNIAQSEWLKSRARNFVGADLEALKTAHEISEQGLKYGIKGSLIRPSAWAKEVPHIVNLAEVFDEAFHMQQPFRRNALEYYTKGATETLEGIGAVPLEDITKPHEAVSVREAGQKALDVARDRLQEADKALEEVFLRDRAAQIQGFHEEQTATGTELTAKMRASRRAADNAVNELYGSIRNDVADAAKAAETDMRSGDLWQKVGDRFRQVYKAEQDRFQKMYNGVSLMTEDIVVPVGKLAQAAKNLLDKLPEEFQAEYPAFIRNLQKFQPPRVPKGQPGAGRITGPATLPWAQLWHLRSQIRMTVRGFDLAEDVWGGAYKYFAEMLHTSVETVPESLSKAQKAKLTKAIQHLGMIDDMYADFIGPYHEERIKAVIAGLKTGLPANPKTLYRTLFPDVEPSMVAKVQQLIGPVLSSAVKAADLDAILMKSRSSIEGEVDGTKFIREVMRRYESGHLEAIHGEATTKKLLAQVRNLETLRGKLGLDVHPDDTMLSIMQRAVQAKRELEEFAKRDPIKLLEREHKRITAEHNEIRRHVAATRQQSPLGFLGDMRQGAIDAADVILKDPDLLFASASYFGKDSETFKELQKAWLLRLLTGTMNPGAGRLPAISDEVQRLMMPDATYEQIRILAKHMNFLLEAPGAKRSTAGSMAAMSRVNNPWGSLPLRFVGSKLFGLDYVGRQALSLAYGTARDISSDPGLIRWFAKNLNSRDPRVVQHAEAVLKKRLQRAAAAGAAGGELLEQQVETEQ